MRIETTESGSHAVLYRLKCTRQAIIGNYGSISNAALALGVTTRRLKEPLYGRECRLYVIATLQQQLGLSDSEVLACWPMLGRWPRGSAA